LWQFSNSGVHLFVPLLLLADYIMFTTKGHLKKYDPFLFAIVPLVYLIFITIIGFAGATYKMEVDGEAFVRSFPYFFIDYNVFGWWCAIFIGVFTIIYIGSGFLMYLADREHQHTHKD
jgi:hypothetical protein